MAEEVRFWGRQHLCTDPTTPHKPQISSLFSIKLTLEDVSCVSRQTGSPSGRVSPARHRTPAALAWSKAPQRRRPPVNS